MRFLSVTVWSCAAMLVGDAPLRDALSPAAIPNYAHFEVGVIKHTMGFCSTQCFGRSSTGGYSGFGSKYILSGSLIKL